MRPRRLLIVGSLALAAVGLTPGRAMTAPLVVAAPGGALAHVAETVFVAPFVQALQHTISVLSLGPAETAPPARADLTLVDGQTLLAGCKAGAFRKLDWGVLGGRDRMLVQAASECGVGAVLRGLVLAWSRDKFPAAPTWADFWDVARVPGKRGLRRRARGNLEFALIADGVAAADVYGTLRGEAGIERAFRKLDQMKPYVVWWTAEEEAPRLLASGEVLMTSAPADGVLAAARATSGVAPRDFSVQWTGALLSYASWAVLANTAEIEAAQAFLTFASDPKRQGGLGAFPGFGAAVAGGVETLGPAEKAESPATPANLAAGLVADEAFWRDNGEKLENLFESWLAKS